MNLPQVADLTYSIRYSDRAKRYSLRIKPDSTIEVVLPRGTPSQKAEALIQEHQAWICRKQDQVRALRQQVNEQMPKDPISADQPPSATTTESGLPKILEFRACHQIWEVHYQPSPQSGIMIGSSAPSQVTLQGDCRVPAFCAEALRQWLKKQGRSLLLPWLAQVSKETELAYGSGGIRNQKTLWGSCSRQKNISLNAQLLFLPPELVRYVLIHELCHTVHLDHSSQFWALVAQHEPQYRSLDRALSKGWAYVPPWYGF
ncbi:MAG: M48 family metallopeptidase [Prochlorotrichaceae cyanobacterium]